MVKPWEPVAWKGQIVERGQKGDKRHFRNGLFRPKWERKRCRDETAPLSLEGRSTKATR